MFRSRCRICGHKYSNHFFGGVCPINGYDRYVPRDNLEYLEWCLSKKEKVHGKE
jgi:hypothetical protein